MQATVTPDTTTEVARPIFAGPTILGNAASATARKPALATAATPRVPSLGTAYSVVAAPTT